MDYIVYHANCQDGFTSAYIAHKAITDDKIFIPSSYTGDIPEKLKNAKKDDIIYILDFSFSKDQILHLRSKVDRVIVIDHHASSQGIADLPGVIHDVTKSGSLLTWEYFNPGKKPPELVLLVNDFDLYKFEYTPYDFEHSDEYPFSKYVHAYLSNEKMDFDSWECAEILLNTKQGSVVVMKHGATVMSVKNKIVENICKQAFWTTLDGSNIIAVNSPIYATEVGNALLGIYPESPASVVFYKTKYGNFKYSVRSRKNGSFVVNVIAEKFGGGGHPTAADWYSDCIV